MYILISLIAILVISALIGYFMPQTVKLERSIAIHAPKEVVFAEISHLENFVTWSPWTSKDPSMSQSFTGHGGTVGSKYTWKGNKKVGEGSMETTALHLNDRVAYAMNFGPRGQAEAVFTVSENRGNTLVTWAFSSDMGRNPIKHLMGPLMAAFVGKDYTAGLQNLKKKLEQY